MTLDSITAHVGKLIKDDFGFPCATKTGRRVGRRPRRQVMADFYGTLIASSFRVKNEAAWTSDPDVARLKAHATARGGFCDGEVKDGARWWAFGWDDQYPGFSLDGECPICHGSGEVADGQAPEAAGADGTVTCEQCGGTGDREDNDVTDVVQRHIHDGDCCIIAISGNEKLRYNGGTKAYVTARGAVYIDGGIGWNDIFTAEDAKTQLRDWAEKAAAL